MKSFKVPTLLSLNHCFLAEVKLEVLLLSADYIISPNFMIIGLISTHL